MHSNNDHASLYQNRKFYDPWSGIPVLGHDHIGHIMHYFFEDLLLYSWVSCRQTEYRVMISMDASTNVVNFMTPRAGVPVIGLFVCLFVCLEFIIPLENFSLICRCHHCR